MKMKSDTSVCTLLGDVVDSRAAGDRAHLHRALVGALDDVAASDGHALAVTVGDEFQGVYPRLGAALDAGLRVRLHLLPEVDVRIGIGRGPVMDLDPSRGLQDGPGWWAARAALERVETQSRGTALRELRTGYLAASDETEAAPTDDLTEAVNAALACRDHLVGSLSERSLRLLTGLLEGRSQSELAEQEGISGSAVSQQVRSHGIGAILHAHELVRRLT